MRLLHTATVLIQGNRHKPVIRIRVRVVTHRAKDALVTERLQRIKLLLTGLRAGLNLNIVVASQTGTSRNQLTDNDVLLQAKQRVGLSLHCGLSKHAGGLLEGCGRQPGLGGQ